MKTLLLNSSGEPLSFVNFTRLMKLIFNQNYGSSKVEILANWNDKINWQSGNMKLPATVKLKYYVKNSYRRIKFDRKSVFRRDLFLCCYCGLALTLKEATLDHIVPRSKKGLTSWENCVTACSACNKKKANRTLQETGMKLLNKPFVPNCNMLNQDYYLISPKHEDWKNWF